MQEKPTLKPIGVIHSPYKFSGETPRQGRLSEACCEIEVFAEFEEGLEGIEEYNYLLVFYWMHKSNRGRLKAMPPGSTKEKGVFATRSPSRPNPIGFCLVKLLERRGRRLKVKWIDALNGSPLIDIKPYVAEVDSPPI